MMAAQQASPTGSKTAASGPTQYLRDFIAETDPQGTPPEVALKNKHARVQAAKKLADIESGRADRAADAAAARTAADERQARSFANQAARRAEVRSQHVAEEVVDAVTASAEKVGGAVGDKVTGTKEWLANLPTPGSIALLLVVILFFIWAVVPVGQNGETRLQLLWLTLTGKTSIAGEPQNTLANVNPTGQVSATPNVTTLSAGGIASTGVPQTPVVSNTQLLSGLNGNAGQAGNPVLNPNTGFTPDFGIL